MQNKILSLDGIWKIKCMEYGDEEQNIVPYTNIDDSWIESIVPGDVHDSLLKAGKIKDPYYADNSQECEWVTEKDWVYRKTFKLPANFKKDNIKLLFDGIDTYSTVWLNGEKVGDTENMHRQYSFDITDLVNENEENELVVRVKSVKHIMDKFPSDKYFACFNVPRIFVRKAQCHFSWDWAPPLPAVGIWQSVRIVSTIKGHIENVNVKTKIDGRVSFFIKVDRKPTINDLEQSKEGIKEENIEDELLVEVTGGDVPYSKRIAVRGGKNHLTIEIDNPKLWWPHGYGEPNLYNYNVKLLREGVEVDSINGTFGIREVELLQDPMKEGGFCFTFKINNVPVFCKGANWVPLDCFTGTIEDEKYKNLILLAKEANLNMLRIWGGGIYEKDIFYELCDKYGIMVWQDFMFACSDVPDDHDWFIRMVISEAEYQVKRLRNHPSIVYWCGGNEKTGSAGLLVSYGEIIYHYVLRGICNDLDSTRPYGQASPMSFSDLGNDRDSGDTHCNCLENSIKRGVTYFREEINKINTVFNSECAILGPSRYQSMEKFIPQDKLWPLNDLWEFRYKDNPYNTLHETFVDMQCVMARELFGEYDNVKEFLKKAMTAQAEILRAEIEHHRSRKWENSGVMFWMYSDIWPTGTWAVVDYYQLPKPSYYAVKRAYESLTLSVQQYDEDIKLFIINDLLDEFEGKIEFGQATIDGEVIWKVEKEVVVGSNQVMNAYKFNKEIEDLKDSYLFARFTGNGFNTRTTFFHKMWKDINWQEPGLKLEVLECSKNNENFQKIVEISSGKYARMVNLSLPENKYAHFSDNFFDMEPGEVKRIVITSQEDYDVNELRVDHWLTEWI